MKTAPVRLNSETEEALGPGSSPGQEGRVPPLSLRAPLGSLLRLPVLAYRYSLSMFMGRQCRYLPTCSEYADEALARHGAWAGVWMTAGRCSRCHPWADHGYDPVPAELPADASWSRPWRYARQATRPICEAVDRA